MRNLEPKTKRFMLALLKMAVGVLIILVAVLIFGYRTHDTVLFTLWASLGIIGCILGFLMSTGKIRNVRLRRNITLRRLVDGLRWASWYILPVTGQPRLSLSTPVSLAVGIAIFLIGNTISASAVRQLGGTIPKERKLITKGIYGVVRHPMYLGNTLHPIGWSIIFKACWALLLIPLWFIYYIAITFPEEKRLEKEFGDEYTEYKRRVPRFIPIKIRFTRKR